MKTSDHILHSESANRPFRAWCSCGQKWAGVPDMATVRELHAAHFAEANEAEQAEREVRP